MQVFVHVVRKVDISSLVGQTTQTSVHVRGGSSAATVRPFSSHPDQLSVSPATLTLPANGLAELDLSHKSLAPGSSSYKVRLF